MPPLEGILHVPAVILLGLLSQGAQAFHKDVYEPRVPREILTREQKIESPYPRAHREGS